MRCVNDDDFYIYCLQDPYLIIAEPDCNFWLLHGYACIIVYYGYFIIVISHANDYYNNGLLLW